MNKNRPARFYITYKRREQKGMCFTPRIWIPSQNDIHGRKPTRRTKNRSVFMGESQNRSEDSGQERQKTEENNKS
jgi:hypothetical protein